MEVHTQFSLEEILCKIHTIERHLGRVRATSSSQEYQARTLDIDILYYDDITVNEADLKIPHPHIHEREFVMKPLKEIFKEEDRKTQRF